AHSPQTAPTDMELGIELVEVPTKPVLEAGPFPHERFPMAGQQAQLPSGTVETSDWKIRFPQSHSGHRQSVDRIRLAPLPVTASFPRHQPGIHPHQRLAGGQQVALEAAGQMTTILLREAPRRPPRRPPHQLVTTVAGRLERPLS